MSPTPPEPLVRLARGLAGRCRFPAPGSRVDCAVSGGPDSMALLVLARLADLDVTAIHVDHGLRPGSDREARVVAAACDRFDADFVALTVTVEPGPNLEARARAARYAVLPGGVLTGHTMDDQAETVLLNLFRGAGVDGMAGIPPDRRPLLGLRRTETEQVCEVAGLEIVDDPTNRDPAIRRNRIRSELLPLVNAIVDRDVTPILARQAQEYRRLAAHLDRQIEAIDPRDTEQLARVDEHLRRRALRSWIRGETRSEHPVDSATIDRVCRVADGTHRSTDLGDGWRLARTSGRLRIER